MASLSSLKKNLSDVQISVLHKLVGLQEDYEFPPQEEFQNLKKFPLGDSEDDYFHRFLYMTEITILTIPLISRFANRVPFFEDISEKYKFSILKESYGQLMLLRAARRYDPETDTIVFANDQPYTRQNFRSACMGDFTDSLFEFCKTMWNFRVDNGQYALLTVIVILSKRPFLNEEEKSVESVRKFYINLLRGYFDTRLTSHNMSFDQWLHAILEKIFHLGLKRSENTFSILVKNKRLHPHFNRFWDLILCYPRHRWGTKRTLSEKQLDCVCKLVLQLDKYSSQEDLKNVTPFALGDSDEDCIKRNQHMIDMADLTAKRMVEFAKQIPEFETFSRGEQILLLKASFSDVMVLWAASRYHPDTNSIVFANNQPYTKENFASALMGNFADSIFDFCRTMYDLKVNSGEYAILTVIVIFSVQPTLRESVKVLRKFYIEILQGLIATYRPDSYDLFQRFLYSRIHVLRKLRKITMDLYIGLKARNVNFPPFLGELLN